MIICDSVTKLPSETADRAVLSGSHCGIFPAHLAACAGARAVILNDAGIGRDRAGIGGLDYLQGLGIPAAAVSHLSARIGDGEDMARRGVISHMNALAAGFGIVAGMVALEALQRLQSRAPGVRVRPEKIAEHRFEGLAPNVVVVDSASLVEPADVGRIVVAGSHGGLLGGRPETALEVAAAAAVYNDAGIGKDHAGLSRLPPLADRGIAATTVSCMSARIGDGRSTLHDGRISHVNEVARRCGAVAGMSTLDFCRIIQSQLVKGTLS